MEAEFLKETWNFEPSSTEATTPSVPNSQRQMSGQVESSAIVNRPANGIVSSSWEENFQDLSGWCMSNIQGRRDFPAGEFPAATGMKRAAGIMNAGPHNPIATKKTMTAITQQSQMPRDEASRQMISDYLPVPTAPSTKLSNRPSMMAPVDGGANRAVDPFVDSSVSALWATTNTDELGQEVSSWPAGYDLCPTGKQEDDMIIDPKREVAFEPVTEAEGGDAFDLLTYLCEDDMPSPMNGISTNSSRLNDYLGSPSTSGNYVAVSPVTCEPVSSSNKQLLSPAPSSSASSTTTEVSSPILRDRRLPRVKLESSPLIGGRRSSRSTAGKTSREWGRNAPSLTSNESSWTATKSTSVSSNRKKRRSNRDSDSEQDQSNKDISDRDEGDDYRGARQRNNEASRRSRMNKKAKEMEMSGKAHQLEKDNRVLRMKVDELEKLVNSMRNALLRSALKRETKNS